MSLTLSGPIHAGIIAEDAAVSATMDDGGSEADPARYIIGSVGATTWGTSLTRTIVGKDNSYNQLTVQNGSLVSSFSVLIGSSNTGHFNSVTLTGSSSTWSLENLAVGNLGSNNSLIIENGASMTSLGAIVGFYGPASHNSMVIRGTGSSLSSSYSTYVSVYGHHNSLTIEKGASLTTATFIVGLGHTSDATVGSNNSMMISGTNSTLMVTGSSGSLVLGSYGSNNSLILEKGASMVSGAAHIGGGDSSLSAMGSNNTLTVTDSGSLWTNSGTITVGHFGSGNSLTIENGASVVSSGGSIGEDGGQNNGILVAGVGSTWINSGDLALGIMGSGNTLTISNGALVTLEGTFSISQNGGSDNFLRLDDGFFAWKGDHAAEINQLILEGVIQHWNGIAWIAVQTDDVFANFLDTDEEAFTRSGYQNLGGYTILGTTAIPEPGSLALMAGAALLAAPFMRRRRK